MATEIQMAKIAVDRGASGDVREFARRTLIESSKARRDLAQIIAGSGDQTIASLPPSCCDRAAMTRLRAATPEHFDRLYLSLRLAAQEIAIRRFNGEASWGQIVTSSGLRARCYRYSANSRQRCRRWPTRDCRRRRPGSPGSRIHEGSCRHQAPGIADDSVLTRSIAHSRNTRHLGTVAQQ